MPKYLVVSDRYVPAAKGSTVEMDEQDARSLVRGEQLKLAPKPAPKPAAKPKKGDD